MLCYTVTLTWCLQGTRRFLLHLIVLNFRRAKIEVYPKISARGPQIAWVGRLLQRQTSRFPSLRAPPWPTHPRPHQWCNTSGANDVNKHTVQPRECWNYGGQKPLSGVTFKFWSLWEYHLSRTIKKTLKNHHLSPLLLLIISLWAVLKRFFAAHFSTILPPPKMGLA